MNRFKTLVAAASIATAAGITSLPAQATEYYVVHPDGRITTEYSHDNAGGYTYFSFGFGAPFIWFNDSDHYDRHYRDRDHYQRHWNHEWREHHRDNHHRFRDHRGDNRWHGDRD